jgi:hypothetical protein
MRRTKNCLPGIPVLAAPPGSRPEAWQQLLHRAGYSGTENLEKFDHVLETDARASGADMIDDTPLAYGHPIGKRHASRRIIRKLKLPSKTAAC